MAGITELARGAAGRAGIGQGRIVDRLRAGGARQRPARRAGPACVGSIARSLRAGRARQRHPGGARIVRRCCVGRGLDAIRSGKAVTGGATVGGACRLGQHLLADRTAQRISRRARIGWTCGLARRLRAIGAGKRPARWAGILGTRRLCDRAAATGPGEGPSHRARISRCRGLRLVTGTIGARQHVARRTGVARRGSGLSLGARGPGQAEAGWTGVAGEACRLDRDKAALVTGKVPTRRAGIGHDGRCGLDAFVALLDIARWTSGGRAELGLAIRTVDRRTLISLDRSVVGRTRDARRLVQRWRHEAPRGVIYAVVARSRRAEICLAGAVIGRVGFDEVEPDPGAWWPGRLRGLGGLRNLTA